MKEVKYVLGYQVLMRNLTYSNSMIILNNSTSLKLEYKKELAINTILQKKQTFHILTEKIAISISKNRVTELPPISYTNSVHIQTKYTKKSSTFKR